MPDEPIGQGASGTGGSPSGAAAPAAPAASSPSGPSPPPSSSGASGAAPPSGAGGAGQAAGGGFRETLRAAGLDLTSQYQDDPSAVTALIGMLRQAQQNQQLAQYGQVYVQHADQFQAYLRQQQAAEQQRLAQQNQRPSWWKAPEFDPAWRNKLTRDEQGNLVPVQGADPSIVNKYRAALEHQQGFLDKFAFDPIGAIQPGIEEVAARVAQQLIQQHLGGYQEQVFANSWVNQNSSWIYAKDQSGNVLTDPQTGRPALSQYGQNFARYVQELQRSGVRDVAVQQKLALAQVQRDYMAQSYGTQLQQQSSQQQGDAAKAAFLQRGQAAGAGAPANYGAPAQGNQPPMKNQRDLMNTMLAAMAASGFGPGQSLV